MGDAAERRGDTAGGEPTSGPPTGPIFAEGVEGMARDLLAASTPTPDQTTARISQAPEFDTEKTQPPGAAGVEPTAHPSPTPSRPKVPKRLGPYELLDELGHGGMGVVYRARHVDLGTLHAVKVLIAGEHASEELIARFRREAAAVAKMGRHPNIITVHDLAEEGGLTWYSMELAEGKSLRHALKEHTFTPREAATIVEKAARALHFAHTHGIIHRDVKPENIVLRPDGEPLVMDFGLAREEGSKDNLTLTGQIMGTLAYMAPEQARGDVSALDARTDVYAIGGVLYDMMTGLPPHPGNQVALVLPIILRGDIVPPHRLRPDAPRDLETICMKALSLEQHRRYATAEALADDLSRFRRGEPIRARPAGPARRAWMFVKRHQAASLATASVLAILLAAGSAWYVTPGGLVIAVKPEDASVRIDGEPESGRKLALRAGGHVVEVSAPDHEPETREVLIERRGEKELRVELRHHKGTLVVEGNVPEMTIEAGRKTFGARGRDEEFDTGRQRCRAWAPGHYEREVEVEVRRDEATSAFFWLDKGLIWEKDAPGTSGSATHVSDVNGDGVMDVYQQELSRAVLYSGKDGAELLSMTEGVSPRTGAHVAEMGRLGRCMLLSRGEGDTFSLIGPPSEGQDPLLWTWRRVTGKGRGDSFCELSDSIRGGFPEVAVCFEDGELVLLDGRKGSEVSRGRIPVTHPRFNPCIEGGILAFTAFEPDKPTQVAFLRPETRDVRWAREFPPGSIVQTVPLNACALVLAPERWHCLDLLTGATRWEIAPPSPSADCRGVIEQDVDARGLPELFLYTALGVVVAIRAESGEVLWFREQVLEVPRGIADLLLVETRDDLLGVDGASGDIRWRHPGSPHVRWAGRLEGQPAVLTGIEGRGLVCLDAAGRERWALRLDHAVCAYDVVEDFDGRGSSAIVLNAPRTMVGLARPPAVLWERKAEEPLQATPIVLEDLGGRRLVLQKGAWQGRSGLMALDGRTGAIAWKLPLESAYNRAPATVDWDGDGALDVVGQWRQSEGERGVSVHVVRARDGKALARHPLGEAGANVYSVPAAADLNGDGRGDVALLEWDTQQVRAIDGATGATLWKYATGQPNMGGLGAADLDGDGLADLVAPSIDGFVHAIRGRDGGSLWKTPVGGSRSPPTMADMNEDGTPDALLLSCPGTLWVLDGRTGAALWSDAKGGEAFGRPAICAIERVGMVIIAPFGPAGVAAFTWPGKGLLWQGPKGKGVTASPVVADIDADGRLEVVVGTMQGELLVLDAARGSALWSWKLAEAVIEADPAVADLDGDGLLDIVIASQSRTLTAIRGRRSNRK